MSELPAPSDGLPTTESISGEDDRNRRLRRWGYVLLIAVAAAASLARIMNAEPLQSANDRSRWCTVWALVEQRTFRIDDIIRKPGWSTIDMVRHDGHFYSTKPALLPTMVAGVYWMVKQTVGWDLLTRTEETTRLILVLVNWLPMIIAWSVFAAMAERYASSEATKWFLVIAACFGTLLTPFLCTLNNHTVAAVSVVFALYSALRIRIDGVQHPVHFVSAGLFAAFACVNELPAALFGLATFGLLFARHPKRTAVWFVPASCLVFAAFFYTTYLQTGGWKPFYMYYGTEKYEYVHEGIPSYWMNPRGIDRNLDSPLMYFVHCTIGHHGILSLSPLFLLTLLSWSQWKTWRKSALEPFLWLGLGLTAAILAFYLSRTQNYNYGGNSAALRWALWLIPFWLLALIPVCDRWGSRLSFRAVASGLLAVSVFSASYPLTNPWQQPWLFQLMERWSWIDYQDKPPELPRTLTTWFSHLPEVRRAIRSVEDSENGAPFPADDDTETEWIEFESADLTGQTVRMKLIAWGAIEDESGRTVERMEIRQQEGTQEETRRLYHIDRVAFQAGAYPQEFLVWPDGEPEVSARREAATLLRGLPRSRAYRGGRIRYLKTGLRTDAFECHRAASRVRYRPSGSETSYWYRCDLWLSDEVPFGVAQVEWTVSDARTGAVVERRLFTVRAVSRLRTDSARPAASGEPSR